MPQAYIIKNKIKFWHLVTDWTMQTANFHSPHLPIPHVATYGLQCATETENMCIQLSRANQFAVQKANVQRLPRSHSESFPSLIAPKPLWRCLQGGKLPTFKFALLPSLRLEAYNKKKKKKSAHATQRHPLHRFSSDKKCTTQ